MLLLLAYDDLDIGQQVSLHTEQWTRASEQAQLDLAQP